MRNILIFTFLITFFGCSTTDKDKKIKSVKNTKKFDWKKYKKENSSLFMDGRDEKKFDFVELKPNEVKFLKQWFHKDNLENLKAIDSSDKRFSWFENEIKKMPKDLLSLISKRMIGWTLIENAQFAGTILPIYDSTFHINNGILVLNTSIYKKKFNDWCSFKISQLFNLTEGQSLDCGYKKKNISVVPHALLHESGHIFSFSHNFFPQLMNKEYRDYYPFSRLSWLEYDNRDNSVSVFDDFFKRPHFRDFYTNSKKLNVDDTIKSWQKTNFMSLYAASNPREDWAESFAFYLMKKYYKTEFFLKFKNKHGKEIINSCSQNKNCDKKMKVMKVFIENIDLFI